MDKESKLAIENATLRNQLHAANKEIAALKAQIQGFEIQLSHQQGLIAGFREVLNRLR